LESSKTEVTSKPNTTPKIASPSNDQSSTKRPNPIPKPILPKRKIEEEEKTKSRNHNLDRKTGSFR